MRLLRRCIVISVALAQARRKRDQVCANLTRLGTRLSHLESESLAPADRPEIVWLGLKIKELDSEFRDLQNEIFELIEDDEEAEKKEQEFGDNQAEKVAGYISTPP